MPLLYPTLAAKLEREKNYKSTLFSMCLSHDVLRQCHRTFFVWVKLNLFPKSFQCNFFCNFYWFSKQLQQRIGLDEKSITVLGCQRPFPFLQAFFGFKSGFFRNDALLVSRLNFGFPFFFPDEPGQPNITGLRGSVLDEGQIKRITCISMAGNPLPDLKWFRGDDEIPGLTTEKDEEENYSRSDLIVVANRTDNGLKYR